MRGHECLVEMRKRTSGATTGPRVTADYESGSNIRFTGGEVAEAAKGKEERYFIKACVAKTISSLILWPLPQNPCFPKVSTIAVLAPVAHVLHNSLAHILLHGKGHWDASITHITQS